MHPSYLPVFFWSLIIFVSFLGYGETLRRALNRTEFNDLGWGLTSAWGMATTLAIGGLLMAFHLAITPILTAVVVLGAALGLFYGVASLVSGKVSRSTFRVPLSDLILYLLAAIAFASSIAWSFQVDPNDDVVCYLFYPYKILQTGSLIEPFNVRRMGTYGGQSLLQALVIIVGGEKNGHIPDRGFGMLMLLGMLMHNTKGTPRSLTLLRFIAVGCLFFVAVPRINTGSSLTGSALILALILTLARWPLAEKFQWRHFLIPSLLIAGAGALRPTYLVCAAGMVALEPFIRIMPLPGPKWESFKRATTSVLPVAIGSFMFLLPWMSVLWQSNHTPMYPIMGGTMNPEFARLGNKGGPIFDIAHALAYLMTPEALVLLFCLSLAFHVRNHPLAIAASLAAVGVSGMTSYKFGVTILSESYRYTFPMLMPVAFWLVVRSLADAENEDRSLNPKILFPASLALVLLLTLNLPNAGRELSAEVEAIPQQMQSNERMVNEALTRADLDLQKCTPVGSKIFAAVDTPYGLDFRRNEIFTADFPGGSAIGNWPLGQGPEALRTYLVAQGFKYIIASDFDNAMLLYTRKHWKEHQRPEWFYKEVNGKYFLDFMDNVDALASNGLKIATAANLRLIDLTAIQTP